MKKGTIIFLVILFGVLGILGTVNSFNHVSHVEGKVTDKVVKVDSSTKHPRSVYLVFVETDKGTQVFEVTDSVIMGRYDSSNVYGSIKTGKTYKMKVRGYRIPILSSYENIDTFTEVK